MTTNAVKHGALSVGDGNVAVTWALQRGAEGDDLVLNWIEQVGPPLTPPARFGFGATLIERGLAHDLSGEVAVDFAPTGVRATLHAPLGRPCGQEEGECKR